MHRPTSLPVRSNRGRISRIRRHRAGQGTSRPDPLSQKRILRARACARQETNGLDPAPEARIAAARFRPRREPSRLDLSLGRPSPASPCGLPPGHSGPIRQTPAPEAGIAVVRFRPQCEPSRPALSLGRPSPASPCGLPPGHSGPIRQTPGEPANGEKFLPGLPLPRLKTPGWR
jgi:hypothetical protein